MRFYKILKRGMGALLVLSAIAIIQSSVLADKQNITIDIPDGTLKNYNGAVIARGNGFIQLIRGAISQPSRIANANIDAFTGGDAYARTMAAPIGQDVKGTVGGFLDNARGNGGYYFDNILDHPLGGSYYLRYWTEDGFYVNSNSQTPWSAGEPVPTDMVFNLFSFYKAAKPPAPRASAGNFSLKYNDAQKKYLPTFSITVVDQPDANDARIQYQYSGRALAIRKKGDANWKSTFNADSQEIQELDPVNPYYVTDGTTEYEIMARAWNNFGGNAEGDQNWGPIATFKIPATAGGVGENVEVDRYKLTINLTKRQDGFGINTVVFPQLPDGMYWAWTDKANVEHKLFSIEDLLNMVNLSAGENVVRTIGYWDRDNQSLKGGIVLYEGNAPVLSNPSGSLSTTEPLQAQVGYQVYVTKSVMNIAIKGVR